MLTKSFKKNLNLTYSQYNRINNIELLIYDYYIFNNIEISDEYSETLYDIESLQISTYSFNDLILLLYKQSKIPSLDDHYSTMARICYTTHISQVELNSMEFWEYNNFAVYLTKIIEEENKRNGSGGTESTSNSYNDALKSSQRKMSNSMSSMSNKFKP